MAIPQGLQYSMEIEGRLRATESSSDRFGRYGYPHQHAPPSAIRPEALGRSGD